METSEGGSGMTHDVLLGDLVGVYDRFDPPPETLVERILVALACDEIDARYELLTMIELSPQLLGARGTDDALTFSFESDGLSMVLRVTSTGSETCRVDGWVSPPQMLIVSATQGGQTVQAQAVDDGRFEFPTLASGATRFLLHPDPTKTNLVTPAIDL